MEFKKYQHIERVGTSAVNGIEFGKCFVSYKVDGSNASCWLNSDGDIRAGSRNRELTLENDNHGFYKFISDNSAIQNYLTKHPTHRLYGEWLVRHSLKTYRDDAWRRFYIFDITIDKDDDEVEYIPYEIYQPLLEEFNLDYIPPLAIINNPTEESLIKCLEKTGQFLVKDGEGQGEGIVVKNYDFYNQYNKQIWAKIVTNEFKEKNHKIFGSPEINSKTNTEQRIVDDFCTEAFIEKEFAKIVNDNNGEWNSGMIGKLLGVIYHELVVEEIWNILKKYKYPTIDFKTLNRLIINKVKMTKKNIF